MDKKTTDIVAYLSPIGWVIAMCAGDKEGSKFQLNQTLVLWIAEIAISVVGQILGIVIGLLGSLITGVGSLFCFVCWIIGLIGACQGADKPMPLFSSIKILK